MTSMMKTKYLKLLRWSFTISLLITLIFPLSALGVAPKAPFKVISGRVYDSETRKAISNATLTAEKTSISTVTNSDGFFSLKFNDSIDVNAITVSHVGYHNKLITIGEGNQDNLQLFLSPNVIALKEVVVEGKDAVDIVKEAILKIETNNSNKNTLQQGFYRESAQKRGTYITVAEAVINIYKSPYTRDVNSDAVQVLKGRTLLSPKLSDTIVVKAQGGPNIAKYLDIVKNKDIMLDIETIDFYKFKIDGFNTIDDEYHYIISFAPQVTVPYALYYGKLYINKNNLIISRAELTLDVSDKGKATQMVLIKKPAKMRFQLNSLTSVITYKQYNDKSYLNYISSEVKFKCNWKKLFYIFAPTYTITSEVVITDRTDENVKRIASKDIFGPLQALPDKIENFYDPNFWEAYNIIEPTESLESAVNKLRKHKE